MIGIKKILENEKRLGYMENESKNEIFNKSNVPNQDNLQISTNLFYEFINKPDILKSNAKLWNSFLDKRLHEFVIIHNFDFYEISNRFQSVVVQPLKYYFNEDEIRKHWSFLYACRKINFVPEDTYYKNLKTKYDFEIKPQNFGEIRVNNSSSSNEIFEELKEIGDLYNNIRNRNCENKMIIEENEEDVPELEMNVNPNKYKENDYDKSTYSAKVVEPIDNNKFDGKLNLEKKSEEKTNISLDNSSKNNQISNKDKDKENDNNYESKLFYTPEYRPLSVKNEKVENNTTKKEPKVNKSKSMVHYNEDSDEDEIFPINFEKAPMNNNYNSSMDNHFQNNYEEYSDYDYSFQKTKNFDDFVKENEKLKKQYEDINKYFTFAMKGISHLIPKMMEDTSNINTSTNKIEDAEIDITIEDKEKQYFLEVGKKINDYVQEAVRYCLYIGKFQ